MATGERGVMEEAVAVEGGNEVVEGLTCRCRKPGFLIEFRKFQPSSPTDMQALSICCSVCHHPTQ